MIYFCSFWQINRVAHHHISEDSSISAGFPEITLIANDTCCGKYWKKKTD